MSLQLRYFHHHGEMMVSHLCSEVFEPKVVTERPSCILFNAFLHRSYSYKISPVMKTEIDQLNLEFGVLLKAIHFWQLFEKVLCIRKLCSGNKITFFRMSFHFENLVHFPCLMISLESKVVVLRDSMWLKTITSVTCVL